MNPATRQKRRTYLISFLHYLAARAAAPTNGAGNWVWIPGDPTQLYADFEQHRARRKRAAASHLEVRADEQ